MLGEEAESFFRSQYTVCKTKNILLSGGSRACEMGLNFFISKTILHSVRAGRRFATKRVLNI